MTTIPSPYYGGGQVPNPPDTIQTVGKPSAVNIDHPLGTLAIDNSAAAIYGLASKENNQANWVALGGNANSVYPITPYVVGPAGQAEYQTVQAGIDAAVADGGGMVYVQAAGGPYNENLNIGVNIVLTGDSETTSTIIGKHTLPATGNFAAYNIFFQSTTDIFSSNTNGGAVILLDNCTCTCDDGYIFNLPNWTSSVTMNTVFSAGNNGTFNNVNGAAFSAFGCNASFRMTKVMQVDGPCSLLGSAIGSPITFSANSLFTMDNCFNTGTITTSAALGRITNCHLAADVNPAITLANGGFVDISASSITSTAVNVITGNGSLVILDTSFTDNATISGPTVIEAGGMINSGNININSAGSKILIAEGTNASVGTSAPMVNGAITVSTTAVTAASLIFLSINTLGTVPEPNALYVSARTPGTSFTITSASNNDTSTVSYWIIN